MALVVTMPLWLRVVTIAFFGGGALIFVYASLARRTAVRVDSAGITLRTSPFYPKSTTALYPWQDVVAAVIWRPALPSRISRPEFVGVDRRAGAPPLTARFTGRSSQSAAGLVAPGIPPEVAVTGTRTNGWKLDRGRLASAVAYLAASVPVHDTTTGKVLIPPQP